MDTKLITKTLTDFTEEAIKKYIKETVEERAIPDFKDGLKPVQRRILWDMYKQGLFHNLAHRKAAKVVGDVIARFHCHGDCLDGNTRIYCLDGNSYKIKDLLGKEIEVLAYDQETKQIVPAVAKDFRIIEKDNLYTLKLSNGGEIKCSGNHPILMEDGSYKKAEDLKPGDFLYSGFLRDTQIISIEKQEGSFQLYDFTVDKYHNMAILNSDAGISFVHNSSVFQAMVNMAQPNKKYYFIHGQGNWGSWSGDPAAAMRYVECKLSELADDCLLNKDYLKVVPYVDNFDGTEKEPIYLPARLPFALMSNLAGIATAVRTCLPCLEIGSLVDCCIYYLKNKDLPTTEISKLKFDDIYGGKCVSTQEEIIKLFTDGIASLTFEPTYNVYKDKIELIGIPDGFDFDKVAEKLEELPEVKSVKDESTKDIKIGIYLTKSYNKDSLEKILSKTRVKFNYSINILNRQIQGEDIQANYKETSVLAVIKNWCKYRVKLEKDYLGNLIKEKQADIDYQSLLYKASTNLKVIFKALQEQDSKVILMDKLKITDKEADIILDLPIRRLSKLSEEKTKNLLDNLKKDLECLNSKLNNVVNEVVKDLQGLKRKYGNGAKNQRS